MAKYRKYSKEFKLQASRLVTEQGYSYQQAAQKLGTIGWSIRNWVQKFRQTGELPANDQPEPPTHRFSVRNSAFVSTC